MRADESTNGVDIETICKLLNIGRRYFYDLKLLSGTPPDISRGRYDASRWALWYMRYLSAEVERRGAFHGAEPAELRAARLALLSAQVESIQMENRVVAGTLLEADKVEIGMTRKLTNAKMRLRSIPSSLGPHLVNRPEAYCTERLAVSIDQALTELDGDVTGRTS
jgi:phage terminase Nu1 subunit (DNA packaging protein)